MPFCGGPLHQATYQRKPRGGPPKIPEEYTLRLSLCCGREGCRRRILPLSVMFWGRRVYWGAVIIVVCALGQQRTEGYSAGKVQELFGVPRLTLKRWLAYFREIFPQTQVWQLLRGRFMPPVEADSIPSAVLKRLGLSRGDPEIILIRCMCLFAGAA